MPTKAELYSQLASDTARRLTGNWERWADFLSLAGRLYKYPYSDQLLIYAQRPDATINDDYYYSGGAYYYMQPADDDQE